MATSVKIATDTKDKLEQLQAEIKLETGRKVTQQELLDRLVSHGFDSKEAFIDSFRDDFEGLSEGEIEQFFSGTFASGSAIDEDDIDRILYEQEAVNE
ncbi:hypothetical protein [Halorhabdus rudnickae]|uniref:hypothetical protein n=1 Tax=Halorhabdus rudnickae TaxID=1775544 RepID=UPI001082C571|nr:hypothetical protein [Halorhabdus rudnickae]